MWLFARLCKSRPCRSQVRHIMFTDQGWSNPRMSPITPHKAGKMLLSCVKVRLTPKPGQGDCLVRRPGGPSGWGGGLIPGQGPPM